MRKNGIQIFATFVTMVANVATIITSYSYIFVKAHKWLIHVMHIFFQDNYMLLEEKKWDQSASRYRGSFNIPKDMVSYLEYGSNKLTNSVSFTFRLVLACTVCYVMYNHIIFYDLVWYIFLDALTICRVLCYYVGFF